MPKLGETLPIITMKIKNYYIECQFRLICDEYVIAFITDKKPEYFI